MPTSFSRAFERDLASASVARRFCRDLLQCIGLDWLGDVAELLLSELVTNAVVHARSPVTVSVGWDGTHVRFTVSDESPDEPVYAVDAEPFAEHGRGLKVLDSLADTWGVEECGIGKAVWFELDTRG